MGNARKTKDQPVWFVVSKTEGHAFEEFSDGPFPSEEDARAFVIEGAEGQYGPCQCTIYRATKETRG